MHNIDLSFNITERIRETTLDGLKIGSNTSHSFMSENENSAKPLLALEFLYSKVGENLKQILEDSKNADLVSIKFDIGQTLETADFEGIKTFLKNLDIEKPLILRGANDSETDKKLVPLLAEFAPKAAIIAFAEEQTYEEIVPSVIAGGHILVLRTPIDINLAKELNILSSEKGLNPDRILIDPDMGGLGYGLDYGYSIIERIRQAAFEGDKMLNMPIIAFIGEESYRAKEAKTDVFAPEWGAFEERSVMWEVSGACAMMSAGADIVVLWNPKSVDVLKQTLALGPV